MNTTIKAQAFLQGYLHEKTAADPVLRPLPEGFSPAFTDLLTNTLYREGVGQKALEGLTDGIPYDPRKLKAYKAQVMSQHRSNPADLLQIMKWWRRTPKNPYRRTSPVRRKVFSNISPDLFTEVSSFLKADPGYVANYIKTSQVTTPTPVPQEASRLPAGVVDEALPSKQET